MDAALTSTLEALLDPARVRWSRERAALGQEPAEGELFLGVGSRDAAAPPHPRMLLWKLPQWRAQKLRSTTEVVLRSAAPLDALALPLAFRLHDPTLDCVVAAALATYRVLHRRWPEHHAALGDYVSEWEQGRTERAGAYTESLASVYYAAMHAFPGEGGGPSRELASLVTGVLGRPLEQLQSLPAALISNRVARRLKADTDLYRAELSRAWQVQLDLPVELQPQAWRRVDALFLSSPQDVTVLKLLARPDAEASSYKRGFEFLAVHVPNEPAAWGRHTISIAPESPGTLGDLALQLDRLEGDQSPDGTPRVKGQPRFSFQPEALGGLADPWYSDGYAWTKRRSTIVAPPFAGTRLSREAIWEATWQRFHVGRNVHVTASRTVYCRAFRRHGELDGVALAAAGWKPLEAPRLGSGLLPSVAESFLGGDVAHYEQRAGHDDAHEPPPLDQDFALFLVTLGQRASAFELTRRMGEVERASRQGGLRSLAPSRTLRGDVMLFRNSLWYSRVSEEPELNARYDAWRDLHGLGATVDALRDQTTELDEYRKERFENLVGVLLFLFLPITIVSGFFSGAQFNELDLRAGLPWTTTGWILFLLYTAFFSLLVFGTVLVVRLRSTRRR
jgi:hypothetical protein